MDKTDRRADALPNLITRRQYNQRRKLTARLGEEIRKDIVAAMDGKENVSSIDSKPVNVCKYVNSVNHSEIGQVKYALI